MGKAKLDALADITSPNQGLIGGTLHAGQPVLWSEVNIEDVGLFQTSCNILCGQVLEPCKNIKIYQKFQKVTKSTTGTEKVPSRIRKYRKIKKVWSE